MARVLLTLLSLCVSACPGSTTRAEPTPATCSKRFEQCKLSDGVLGVCNDVACPAGKEPPCLGCVSQH